LGDAACNDWLTFGPCLCSDPQIQREFADTLYEGGAPIFTQGLREDGILIAQVGEANTISSPSGEFSIDQNRLKFIDALVELGFKAVREYEESHNGFENPWEFIVAFKKFNSKSEWFASSADVDLQIRKRGMITVTGGSPFLYFDGATMESYRYPSKGSEVAFCRTHENAECMHGHGFDPERQNLPLSSLTVKQLSLGETAGRGVFAEIDIPESSYIGLDKLVPHIHMSSKTTSLALGWKTKMNLLHQHYRPAKALSSYTHGYGHFFSCHVR
jgi:hypothetical protein